MQALCFFAGREFDFLRRQAAHHRQSGSRARPALFAKLGLRRWRRRRDARDHAFQPNAVRRSAPPSSRDLDARGPAPHAARARSRRRARASWSTGASYVAFCSNDYLGLAAHPALIAAAREGAERFGVGAGASHLILGHTRRASRARGARSPRFVGLPRALLFSTGYMANLGDRDRARGTRRRGVRRPAEPRVPERRGAALARRFQALSRISTSPRSSACWRLSRARASSSSPTRYSAWTATSRRCRICSRWRSATTPGSCSTTRTASACSGARGRGVLEHFGAALAAHRLHGDARQGGRRVRRFRRRRSRS